MIDSMMHIKYLIFMMHMKYLIYIIYILYTYNFRKYIYKSQIQICVRGIASPRLKPLKYMYDVFNQSD